jgi:cysteine desulfurase family protein
MAIYLDNAATSWPKPESVYQAIDNFLRNNGASPGRGGHERAREAGALVYTAREKLAVLFGINDPSRISFACNATDALNTALLGTLKPGDTVVTTAMEHNAVVRPLRYLAQNGILIKVAGCDLAGRVNMADMKQLIDSGAKAVVMTHASNVTGALMPVAQTGQLTRRSGALLIVDAAQTAGTEDIDVESMCIDILAFSGHKNLFGPQGTGGLYVRSGIEIKPLRYGGTGSLSESDVQPDFMPDMLESGTINTPGIAGLSAGVAYILETGLQVIRQKEMHLSNLLRQGLADMAGITLLGPGDPTERTAVVSFTGYGLDSSMLSYQLDQNYGIITRGGLHCAPWAHRTIKTVATGALRLSPGYFNTEQDIKQALGAIETIVFKEVSR